MCRGKDLQTILEMVDETLDPQDEDVVKRILDFVEEAERTPYIDWSTNEPFRDDEGQIIHEQHHFVDWLQGLQAGSWSLPERMPRVVLEHYAERHGIVLRRCEDCLMAMPQRLGGWNVCPVCGGERISWKKTTGPPWDPEHIYTPLI
jgi:hypothetical protein